LRGWFAALSGSLETTDEPLEVARALADLRAGILHGAAAAALALVVLALARRQVRLAGAVAIAGLILDLCLANADNVVTVPQAAFEGVPRALELIEQFERENPSPGPFRVQRVGRWWPTSWTVGGAPRDFETITRWERATLRPHYNLPTGIESTFYLDTIESLDYGLFFLPWTLTPDPERAASLGLAPGQKVWYFPRRGFDLWNTRYFLVPARLDWASTSRGYAAVIPRSTFLYPPLGAFDGPDGAERRRRWGTTEDFRILRNEAAFPRAWVVHRAYLIPPIRGLRLADRSKLMQEILYADDEFWHVPGVPVRDPRIVAWVETNRPNDLDPLLSRAEPDPSEVVTITRDEPQLVEMTAVLRTPGLVVVADMYDPGWTVTVNGRPGEILRTNRAMRGVALPAGTHQLVFRYEPLSFRLGLALSLIGLATMTALVVWSFRGRGSSPSDGS
jgi:hypothetical protein